MKHTVIFTILLLTTTQLPAQSMDPGLWKTQESVKLNGLPLPSPDAEECITASQARDAKATITQELKKHGCTVTKWNIKNQKLDATLNCDNETFTATGKLEGTFSRRSYRLKGEATGTFQQMLPAMASFELSGQWQRTCLK